MDGLVLALFLLATFLGGLVSGLAGFAMGLVVSAMWLHILSPTQTATLIVGFGFVTQSYAIWTMRKALDWQKLVPYVIGGAIGVPIGTILLTRIVDPAYLRPGCGLLLVVYSLYSLTRPAFKPVQLGVPADFGIGIANGVMGGMTGLSGIIVTIWCQLRGGSNDAQRAVFQPVSLATIMLSAVSLGMAGAITADTVRLYLLGLPFMLAGVWAGLRWYGRLNETAFRKVILLLLLASGFALIIPASILG